MPMSIYMHAQLYVWFCPQDIYFHVIFSNEQFSRVYALASMFKNSNFSLTDIYINLTSQRQFCPTLNMKILSAVIMRYHNQTLGSFRGYGNYLLTDHPQNTDLCFYGLCDTVKDTDLYSKGRQKDLCFPKQRTSFKATVLL